MRRQLSVLVSLLALTAALPGARAAEYYASPNGGGDGSSSSSPMSLSQAVSQAGGGDTVLLLDGQYSGVYTASSSGSSGAWITFRAAPGALPIIQGNGGEQTGFGISGTYVRVEGIVVRGFASGFSNSWGGPNGNLEFRYCIADDHGRNGIAFYSAANVLLEGCIVSHCGHNQGWSSGVNMYGATGTSVVRRTISFENIDASGNGTDGSGFIADESSSGVVFENNVGFRNGGSCIRLTKSGGTQIINNTCVHNGLDPNVQYHDEIFFSDSTSRGGALLRNNLCIPTSGQRGLAMGDGVPDENNIWDGTDSLLVSATDNLDFHLASGASQAIDQGSSGAPSDDIGFDWGCITQQGGQRYSWWQYAPDFDYIRSIGGVAACFNAATRQDTPDIGAYEHDGVVSTGGTTGTGGTGGSTGGTGGDPVTGGTGGDPVTGGTGGDPVTGGTGGDLATGGTGGATVTGGTGGELATGGTGGTGGTTSATGGAPSTGGTGGTMATGGVQATGGSTTTTTGGVPATGGSMATGGVPAAVGGAGSACDAPLVQCGDWCVDLASDPNHCGVCGNACGAGQACSAGTCITVSACQAPLVQCGDWCVDLASDPLNCGGCGVVCAEGQLCSAGVCSTVCGAGLTQCGQSCVDLNSDILNCGACGTTCMAGQLCSRGVCTGTATGEDPTQPVMVDDPAAAATAGPTGSQSSGCSCSTPAGGGSLLGAACCMLLGLLGLERRRRRSR